MLNADSSADGRALADALLRACASLSDEVLSDLPATPEDAAASLVESPFAGRAEGNFVAFEWLESLCSALRLPVAELDNGWDVSDGQHVYFCPRMDLADDADSPKDVRPFVRVDQIHRW